VQGVGEKWIFSSSGLSYGYAYDAVRIRVKVFRITFIFNLNVVIPMNLIQMATISGEVFTGEKFALAWF
jgi:hypothetical protein